MYIQAWITDEGFKIDRIDDDGIRWFLGLCFELEDNDGEIYYEGIIDTQRFCFYEVSDLEHYLKRKFPNDEISIINSI